MSAVELDDLVRQDPIGEPEGPRIVITQTLTNEKLQRLREIFDSNFTYTGQKGVTYRTELSQNEIREIYDRETGNDPYLATLIAAGFHSPLPQQGTHFRPEDYVHVGEPLKHIHLFTAGIQDHTLAIARIPGMVPVINKWGKVGEEIKLVGGKIQIARDIDATHPDGSEETVRFYSDIEEYHGSHPLMEPGRVSLSHMPNLTPSIARQMLHFFHDIQPGTTPLGWRTPYEITESALLRPTITYTSSGPTELAASAAD